MDPDTDAGVVIRTWTDDDGWPSRGYRVRLGPGGDTPLVVGHGAVATRLAQPSAPRWRETDEWQTLQITCRGRLVHVVQDGAAVGIFEIDDLAGEVFFEVQDGAVELRGIAVEELPTRIGTPEDSAALRLLRPVHPQYTPDAMRRGVQGAVRLQVLILPDGSVGGSGVITIPLQPR